MRITWNLQIEAGARPHPSFNSRAIFDAFARIGEYWVIQPVQVGSNPWMRFVVTNRVPNPSWAAWTTGRTIYIPANRMWLSYNQLVFVLTHELGHVITPGNTHAKNALAVMYPSINEVTKNFWNEDVNWYRLSWKTAKRPWNEPNRWKPIRGLEFGEHEIAPCDVGHGSWWDRIRDLFTPKTVLRVEE